MIIDCLVACYGIGKTIVFTSTKADANDLVHSNEIENMNVEVMHGDIPQY